MCLVNKLSPCKDREEFLDGLITKKHESSPLFPEFKDVLQSPTDEIQPQLASKQRKKFHIPQIVYMVLLSAVLHNITDGLAVGVAFADSMSGGLSTSIAVLCHEVPHVIG